VEALMPTRFGVRNVGVKDGRKLRKVVGIVWLPDRHGGHFWEKLSCGHEGRPVANDGTHASQRWCEGCKHGWPVATSAPNDAREDD
jgi:hypothetical protein